VVKNPKNLILLLLSVALVTGTVLMGGCVVRETGTPSPQATQIIENITPQEAFALIQQNQGNPDFVIIDVRTPQEFAEERIEGVINIDFYSETFQDELNILDKDKSYLIYCRTGGRSGSALDIMEELNFREVHNMTGGIIQWKAEGFPTVKP
jgi:rhodanese-related sulfurtransferase